jgi:hypothetical protein
MTHPVCHVKRVCVYTYLTRVNTYSTYKFNKFLIKLEKYIRKIGKIRVTWSRKIKLTRHIKKYHTY